MVESICDLSFVEGTLSDMDNRTFTISSGVPAFLAKLWKLVEDPQSDHLISWSPVSASSESDNMASFEYLILPCHARGNSYIQAAYLMNFPCLLVG